MLYPIFRIGRHKLQPCAQLSIAPRSTLCSSWVYLCGRPPAQQLELSSLAETPGIRSGQALVQWEAWILNYSRTLWIWGEQLDVSGPACALIQRS